MFQLKKSSLTGLITLFGYEVQFTECILARNKLAKPLPLQVYKWSETSCHTKVKEPSQPFYLPKAGGRIYGIIPFSRVIKCKLM